MTNYIAICLAVVAIVIAVIAATPHKVSTLFGSTACSNITCLSGGLRLVTDAGGDFESDVAAIFSSTFKLGSSGTAQSNQVSASCNLQNTNASLAATTSQYVYCTGVTGVTSADNVIMQLSTTTANSRFGQWNLWGVKASTTAGAIDAMLYNGSGASAVPSATAIGSSTNVWAAH